jgi:hypothetical protein
VNNQRPSLLPSFFPSTISVVCYSTPNINICATKTQQPQAFAQERKGAPHFIPPFMTLQIST